LNQAHNSNQANGGSLIKNNPVIQSNIKKDGFREIAKSLNKNGQIGSAKNPNALISSMGV
jgi:hypothetical protein